MFCKKCGTDVSDDAIVCPKCGEKLNYKRTGSSNGGSFEDSIDNFDFVSDQAKKLFKVRNKENKSTFLAGLLALLLGNFGVHKFYMGDNVWGIIYLIFFWTGIPALLGLVEGIILVSNAIKADNSNGDSIVAECPPIENNSEDNAN